MNDTKARPVVWMRDSRKRVRNFPSEVKKEIGVALFDVQMWTTPPDAKPFKGVGSGVFEIVTRHATNTYRTVYAVQIGAAGFMSFMHFRRSHLRALKLQKRTKT